MISVTIMHVNGVILDEWLFDFDGENKGWTLGQLLNYGVRFLFYPIIWYTLNGVEIDNTKPIDSLIGTFISHDYLHTLVIKRQDT